MLHTTRDGARSTDCQRPAEGGVVGPSPHGGSATAAPVHGHRIGDDEVARLGARQAERGAAWVRCRARSWQVLDQRHLGNVVVWRLARGADLARTFAAPPDDVQPESARTHTISHRAWVHGAVSHARSLSPVWWPAGAAGLAITHVPFQYVPSMAILSGHHRRVLLADEVGMGKTVQAAILLHEVHTREPDAASLVVAPAGLVPQWSSELRARGHVQPVVLDAVALRREAAHTHAIVDASRPGTCCVVSLDLLRLPEVATLLVRTVWTLLVVDEAHLCAPGTARHEAVSRVAAVSSRVLLLTATPHAPGTSGAELLRRIGERPREKPMLVVRRQSTLLERPMRRTRVLEVCLDQAHLELCQRLDAYAERARRETGAGGLLPALVLRRRAASSPAAVVRSLERRRLVIGTAGPGGQREPGLFDADSPSDQDEQDDETMRARAWSDDADERREIDRLLALARRVPRPGRKLLTVARLVRRCREPVLVFTAFIDTLRALRSCLRNVRVVVVHGQQPEALRTQAIEAFTGGDADVLLTTDASAEGLNLHARCRLVVHAEVPVSARSFLQRTGRVDRYGQTRRVHAVVMASAAVEDREALARLRAKAGDADEWMAGVSPPTCRRTGLAARLLASHESVSVRVEPPRRAAEPRAPLWSGDEAPRVAACRLRHRRWLRLAARVELPAGTTTLSLCELRLSGNALLTTSRVCVALASACRVDQSGTWPVAVWRALLRGHVVRAERLARRLGDWERLAEAARRHGLQAVRPPPGLFDDAQAPHLETAADPMEEHRPADVLIAMDVRAVLERQR